MRKYILLPICFLLTSFSNNKETLSKLERTLSFSKSPEQIIKIHEIVNVDNYNDVFQYVPNINPLNPKKLKRFSSQFGERFHPISKTRKMHLGLDISAPKQTPIHASAKGKVTFIKTTGGYGKNVKIKHKYGFVTRYAHMNTILVRDGQLLEKGEIIGTVGTTGNSTGDHLHFEIIKNGKHIDPYDIINL